MHEIDDAPTAPPPRPHQAGWITSIGALSALGLGAFNYAAQSGQQVEAQRRTDLDEQRLQQTVQRLADALEKSKYDQRGFDDHLRERIADEIKADMRREMDLRCSCPAHGGRRE